MNEFAACKETWEKLASTDPLWAILTHPAKIGRAWEIGEFFQTGIHEINVVFDYLHSLGRSPCPNAIALDFGCGVGRLTQALAKRCCTVHGVDISETMIAEAKRLNRAPSSCYYHVNNAPNLRLFPVDFFDFIYTSIVLQHIPVRHVEQYLREFIRVLKPDGILLFQMPEKFRETQKEVSSPWQKFRSEVQLRSRIRRCLVRIGIIKRSNSGTMQMNQMPEAQLRRLVNGCGARLIDVKMTNSADTGFIGDLRFFDAEPTHGWVSKQYCVVK